MPAQQWWSESNSSIFVSLVLPRLLFKSISNKISYIQAKLYCCQIYGVKVWCLWKCWAAGRRAARICAQMRMAAEQQCPLSNQASECFQQLAFEPADTILFSNPRNTRFQMTYMVCWHARILKHHFMLTFHKHCISGNRTALWHKSVEQQNMRWWEMRAHRRILVGKATLPEDNHPRECEGAATADGNTYSTHTCLFCTACLIPFCSEVFSAVTRDYILQIAWQLSKDCKVTICFPVLLSQVLPKEILTSYWKLHPEALPSACPRHPTVRHHSFDIGFIQHWRSPFRQ